MEVDFKNTPPLAFIVGRKRILLYEVDHQEEIEWDYTVDQFGNLIPIKKQELEITEALENVFKYAECIPVDTDKQFKSKKKAKSANGMRSEYFNVNQSRKYKRACRKIKALCTNNFNEDNVMIVTLTFDANKFPQKDFTDLKTAKAEFSKFIKRMNDHYDNFRHVTVYARQRNRNWHFHMLCNLDANTQQKFIKEIWGLGGVYISHKRDKEAFKGGVNYLFRNLKKNFDEYVDKRAFIYSRGLKSDVYLRFWKLEEVNVILEILNLVDSGDIKAKEIGNNFYLYGTLERLWNPIVMATPKKKKFKHQRYQTTKRKKSGGANGIK